MSNTKMLVTGGAGFIGSHVVDRFIQMGHSVTAVDNLSTGNPKNLNKAARFYNIDICSDHLKEVFEKERPDYICHLAAQISVQSSVREPVKDARTNILGSLNLLENARRYNVKKFIFSSSGGAIYGEPNYRPCDEGHPIKPVSPYGAAKSAVETYLLYYNQVYGLNYTVLRYANVYGPRQDPLGEAGVVAIFAQAMLDGREPTIFGNGQHERDYVYVGDVVEANVLALERGNGGIYNIGTGVGTPVLRIFELLKQHLKYNRPPKFGPARPGDVFKIHLEVSKARNELGWKPTVTLEEGLGHTADYFKAQQKAPKL